MARSRMRLLLQILSLSDRHERKTQLLVGAVAASPIALTIATATPLVLPWYSSAGATVGAELLLAFLLGYIARARGRAAETALWREWGGPPPTRWLRPADSTCSDAQKSLWRGVIHRMTGLKIPASVGAGRSEADIDRVTNDAVRQLRNTLRNNPAAAMVRTHLEDYGFARNLLGVRWHWCVVALLCVLGCAALFLVGERPVAGIIVASVSLVVAILVGQQLPGQVRWCADRYAESLFTAAVIVDESDERATNTPECTPSAAKE